jgi:hypothetical protein
MNAFTTHDMKKMVNGWLRDHYYGVKQEERPEVVHGSLLDTLLILDDANDELIAEHGMSSVCDQVTDIYRATYNLVKMAEKGGWNA